MNVVVLDCNGVLMNSIPKTIETGIEWLEKFFNVKIEKEKLEDMVLYFSGGTFSEGFRKVLESLFPGGYDEEIVKRGSQELFEKMEKIYKEAEPFPNVIEVLRRLAKNYHLVISSGLERIYLEEWLRKLGVLDVFEVIYSGEDGEKGIHLQLIRTKYPGAKIFYVADSLSEMKLGDFSIGVAINPWHQEVLLRGGAQVVISSFDKLSNALTYSRRH